MIRLTINAADAHIIADALEDARLKEHAANGASRRWRATLELHNELVGLIDDLPTATIEHVEAAS